MSSNERSKLPAPKVGHPKSRGGCATCKSRRVKCDQTYPCGHCTRLGLECTYIDKARSSDRLRTKAYERPAAPQPGPSGSDQGTSRTDALAQRSDELAESKQRRMMDFRLLHNWMAYVSRPFQHTTPAPRWGELWRIDLPLIALRSEGVMYALLTMSATHLLRSTADNEQADTEEILAARNQYLVLALQEQRSAVLELDASNADELSFSALLISLNAFSMLRERTLDPYSPPMDWLEMGRGAGSVMKQASELVKDQKDGKLREIIETTVPIHQFFEPQEMDEDMRKAYGPVLTQSSVSEDLDDDTHQVYLQTLIFIANFRKAVRAGEPAYVSLRRLCMFPFTVPERFIEFVREERPRALVVLAYFFAVISSTEASRYLGNTGDSITVSRREIVAIREAISEEWHALLIWPLDEVRATISS